MNLIKKITYFIILLAIPTSIVYFIRRNTMKPHKIEIISKLAKPLKSQIPSDSTLYYYSNNYDPENPDAVNLYRFTKNAVIPIPLTLENSHFALYLFDKEYSDTTENLDQISYKIIDTNSNSLYKLFLLEKQ